MSKRNDHSKDHVETRDGPVDASAVDASAPVGCDKPAVEPQPARFAEGQTVRRPVSDCGQIPAGVGRVEKCCPCEDGTHAYDVRDEATGKTVRCAEADLSPA